MNSSDFKGQIIDEFYIWDYDTDPPEGLGLSENSRIVLWSKYSDTINSVINISIPELVDANRQKLRSSYLSWVHSLGELNCGGKKITEQFMLRSELSYWWMTSVAQKFNISSESNINNAIKMLAFQGVLDNIKPKQIIIASENLRLIESLKDLCDGANIIFKYNKNYIKKYKFNIIKLFPHEIIALMYLIYFSLNCLLPLKKHKVNLNRESGDILFVDVFTHLQKDAILSGEFSSNYWTLLVKKLEDWHLSVTWLHGYFKHNDISSVKKAESIIDGINKKSNGGQFHILLESMVSVNIVPSVVKDYFCVRNAGKRVGGLIDQKLKGEKPNLWILHKDEFEDSIRGKGAISNCIRILMYETALKSLPKQRLGFFISENQPWELALINAWRKYGHGIIVAVPHTVIRFWDLRYHYDFRTYEDQGLKDSLPLPDKFAINGPLARSNIISCDFLDNKLVDVEALRFLHTKSLLIKKYSSKNSSDKISILVCGDFSFQTTQKLFLMIRSVVEIFPNKLNIYFKAHPAYKFNLDQYNDIPVISLDLLKKKRYIDFDVVFTSTITSAAIEAYFSGVKVIQMLSGYEFNDSPLIDQEAIYFVKNKVEFISALNDKNFHSGKRNEIFFNFGEELERWRNLIISDDENYA